jgi:hypothetical protein
MRDNVTPFRPRRAAPKPRSRLNLASHRGRAVLAQLLTVIAFILNYELRGQLNWIAWGFGVAAVATAATNRLSAMPWAATHHEHVLRTVIIGSIVSALSNMIAYTSQILHAPNTILAYVLLADHWIQIAVLIWAALIRGGVGLILAVMRRPIWHPRGLLL